VFKLGAPSFPIGILRALDAKQIDISCEDGDIVVMVSDGAIADGDECAYLVDALKDSRLPDGCASTIADKLLRRAKAEAVSGGDDISVVVLKVKRELCKW
jgi:serine phosphatase RsbU (regulator of sigma subunit)